jgi:hypothetical protein
MRYVIQSVDRINIEFRAQQVPDEAKSTVDVRHFPTAHRQEDARPLRRHI